MKKILLALLCLVSVLFPSCQEEIKNPETDEPVVVEPDYQNNPTTIAVFVDGEEYKRFRDEPNKVYMEPLSKDKLSDTVTVTFKNTGKNPAKLTIKDSGDVEHIYKIEGSVPDVLNPGMSAEIEVSYTVAPDMGLLKDKPFMSMHVTGNFDTRAIDFLGSKTDVPLLVVDYKERYNIDEQAKLLGVEAFDDNIIRIPNFRARDLNEVTIGTRFWSSGEKSYSIDSIELAGSDKDFFKAGFKYGVDLMFTPDEERLYSVEVILNIMDEQFKYYERQFTLVIDVIELDTSFLAYGEVFTEGKFFYTMNPTSDGHMFVSYSVLPEFGFIELDENDDLVKTYVNHDADNSDPIVDSYIDEVNRKIYILAYKLSKSEFVIQIFDLVSDTLNMVEIPIDISDLRYIGQGTAHFVFTHEKEIVCVSKKTGEIDRIPMGWYTGNLSFSCDAERNKYVFLDEEYSHFLITEYDPELDTFTFSRDLDIAIQFSKSVKDWTIDGDNVYLIADDFHAYCISLINGDYHEIPLTAAYPIRIHHYNGHCYMLYRDGYVFVYDEALHKSMLLSQLNLHNPDEESSLIRNGNLYYLTNMCGVYCNPSGGYMKRIPLV